MKNIALLLLFSFLSIVCVKADSRVIGGSDAPENKFPYVALIRNHTGYICGASIINKKYLLTAAHCVYELFAGGIEIVVGTNKFSGEGGQKYYAEDIIVHDNHKRMREGYSVNDIAVIKLVGEISFNDKVQPVKLPEADSEVAEKTKVNIVGFGRTQRSGPYPEVLQYANNQILNHQTCALRWFSFKFIFIEESMICTQEVVGVGACLGDSGSPLVTDDDVQLGIVSFGYPCGQGIPDVFTNIAYFRNWLNQFLI